MLHFTSAGCDLGPSLREICAANRSDEKQVSFTCIFFLVYIFYVLMNSYWWIILKNITASKSTSSERWYLFLPWPIRLVWKWRYWCPFKKCWSICFFKNFTSPPCWLFYEKIAGQDILHSHQFFWHCIFFIILFSY